MKYDINIPNALCFIIAILICILSGSQIGVHFGQYFKVIDLVFLLVFILLAKNLKYPGIFVLMLLSIIVLSNTIALFVGEYDLNILNIIRFPIILTIYSIINNNDLIKILDHYSNIIFFLVAVSLPFWVYSKYNISFMHQFPLMSYGEVYANYYNAIFYTESAIIGDFRNRSIFWEPNVFFVNMSVAFIWLAFIRKKLNLTKYLVFLLGFASSLSTSALIFFPLASMALFIKKRNKISLNKKILGLLILLIIGYIFYNQFGEIFYNYSFRKFDLTDPFYSISLKSRISNFYTILRFFISNPFFGIGQTDLLIMSNSFTGMLYQLGLPFTLLFMYFNSYIFRSIGLFFFLPLYLLLIFSQHFFFTSLFVLLTAVGLHNKDINIFKKHSVSIAK